jgi:uncharacterized protein (TIGR03435 family)
MSAQPMQAIADQLARALNRPVIDRTGLSGVFDLELTYWPARSLEATPARVAPQVPATPDLPGGPTVMEALRDQLGLRLEPTRAAVEVLVIDSVQPPSDN